MPDVDLSREIEAFERQLADIKSQIGGRWVVFLDGQVKGRFQSFGDAMDFGMARFSDRNFLVRELGAAKLELPFLLVDA